MVLKRWEKSGFWPGKVENGNLGHRKEKKKVLELKGEKNAGLVAGNGKKVVLGHKMKVNCDFQA